MQLKDYSYFYYIPERFYQSDKNEPFIKFIMEKSINDFTWKRGDSDKKEPDYFSSKEPYEFTLASDKSTYNLIRKLQNHDYNSEDVNNDIKEFIMTGIKAKANKNYSVHGVNLCILCMLCNPDWTDKIIYVPLIKTIEKILFFNKIKKQYLDNSIFNNIYIIIPDTQAAWWVIDIKNKKKKRTILSKKEIESEKFPYCRSCSKIVIIKNI